MKFKRFLILSFIVILIVLISNAGEFLIVDEKPIKSDVIIGLGGNSILRTNYSVKLCNEGYGSFLLFSGGKVDHEADIMQKEAIRFRCSQ